VSLINELASAAFADAYLILSASNADSRTIQARS